MAAHPGPTSRARPHRLFVVALASAARSARAAAPASARTLRADVGPAVHEVRKSRFVSYAGRARSTAEAALFAARVASEHSRADHVCWACVCPDGVRSIDHGEPAGTAGRPILAALQASELREAVIAVARFRAGPKLGAGGLIRAYGAAARQLIGEAEGAGVVEVVASTSTVTLGAPIGEVGALYALTGALAPCEVVGEEFADDEVRVTFSVGAGREDELLSLIHI